MKITADQERAFYDSAYSPFLQAPDSDLVCNRGTLEADLANPAHPIYERRRLFQATMKVLLSEPAAGLTVLDYGCGTGDWGLMLAAEGASVTFLDLSAVAIEVVQRRAVASGVIVRGEARDGSDLSCFHDGEFDLIFGSAAIHHTLKYPNAVAELMRVLKPGGRLVLAETYGNNKLLNMARRFRWRLSALPDEAGEDIIFDESHIRILRGQLQQVDLIPLNLFGMAKRIFRGRFTNPIVRGLVHSLEAMDGVLLKIAPGLGRYCGELVVIGRK